MPELANHSPRSSQTIALIESSPLAPASWERLAEQARGQNDPLSVKSLEVIIQGLKKIEELYERADKKNPPPRLSVFSQAMFVRLAKAYNSPTLLKEVGLIYLRDLNLPEVAGEHFERSLLLGGPEKELRPLINAAAVAEQHRLTQAGPHEHGLSGIATAQHARPVAPNIIRKTGKMLLPARFTQTAPSLPDPGPADGGVKDPLPATTAECLAQADAAIRQGRLARARVLLEEANKKPGPPAEMWQAWTNLGQALYEAGDYVRVESAFVEALEYDPDEMASHFNAALGYHLNQKFDLATAAYAKAKEIEPRHPKVWCNFGVLQFQLEAYDKAEDALRRAVENQPDYARAWDNLAASLGAQDKLDEAIEACRRAIQLRPDYPEAYFKMGVIYFSNNQLEEAAAAFEHATSLLPLVAYCDAFQAMIQARLEKPEAAEALVRRAAQTDPKCDLLWMAWNDLGLAWFSEKNYAQAAAAYGEATLLKPEEPETWFNLGVSYHQTGDLKGARDSYQHAVDLQASLADAWHNLGIICAQTAELPAAIHAFRQETNWAPGNVRAWYDLGVALEKSGEDREARSAFAQAEQLGATLPPPGPGKAETAAVALPPGLEIKLPKKDDVAAP
jgi:tetratricopeptide (TPR) repeat protein